MDLPVVFMDETGNAESDRFFICGFLEVSNVNAFHIEIRRVRDQIRGLTDKNRKTRVQQLKDQNDIDQLYNFAKKPSAFELKFKKVTEENRKLFEDLVKVLAYKVEFKFTAIVIDREDSHYKHTSHVDMYKRIVRLYFKHCFQGEGIFMPDEFDPGLSWDEIVQSEKIRAVVPIESHASIGLQCCDILGGIISLGLKSKVDYTKSDGVRLSVVDVFQKVFKCNIKENFTQDDPKYINVWTIDFSKANNKNEGSSMDKKPNSNLPATS